MDADERRRLHLRFARDAWSRGQVAEAMDHEEKVGALREPTRRTRGIVAALDGADWSPRQIACALGWSVDVVRAELAAIIGELAMDERERRAA